VYIRLIFPSTMHASVAGPVDIKASVQRRFLALLRHADRP